MKYKMKYGAKASPIVIQESLLAIQKKHGKITPELVLQEAKDKNHPLHCCFTWNIGKAAQKMWVIEARQLISSLLMECEMEGGKTIFTKAYLHIKAQDDQLILNTFPSRNDEKRENTESYYISTAEAMNSPELREYSLRRALKELEAFRRKYASLNELKDFFAYVDRNVLVLPVDTGSVKKPAVKAKKKIDTKYPTIPANLSKFVGGSITG